MRAPSVAGFDARKRSNPAARADLRKADKGFSDKIMLQQRGRAAMLIPPKIIAL
jgi:hypothetical protein